MFFNPIFARVRTEKSHYTGHTDAHTNNEAASFSLHHSVTQIPLSPLSLTPSLKQFLQKPCILVPVLCSSLPDVSHFMLRFLLLPVSCLVLAASLIMAALNLWLTKHLLPSFAYFSYLALFFSLLKTISLYSAPLFLLLCFSVY